MIASDVALAREFGMSPTHAGTLMEFCEGVYRRQRLLLIVCGANPVDHQIMAAFDAREPSLRGVRR